VLLLEIIPERVTPADLNTAPPAGLCAAPALKDIVEKVTGTRLHMPIKQLD
jgi:hypothetical protein